MNMNKRAANLPPPSSSNIAPMSERRPTRVIAISSGKGGVGKTSITTNLAIALAQRGAKVCILDADTGLANINILLNLQPELTIEHLLSGEKKLDEIMLDGPHGIKVIPAASGILECVDLDQQQHQLLSQALEDLESRFDYLLIDTAAGIGETVLQFLASAQYCVLVISPEPTSLTDAFALIRVMKRKQLKQPIYTIINRVPNAKKGAEIFNRFSSTVEKYLRTRIGYMGFVNEDAAVSNAVCMQVPILIAQPRSPASRCISTLAKRIDTRLVASKKPLHFSKYWRTKSQDQLQANNNSSDTSYISAPSGDYLAVAILAYLQHIETNKTEAQQLLQPLIDAGIERFGYSAFKFPGGQSPQPIHAPASVGGTPEISRLVSDIEEPEAAEIIQQLITRHERLFTKSPLDIKQILLNAPNHKELNETECATIIEKMQQHYRERFGGSQENEKNRLIETFTSFTQQVQQQEKRLCKDLQQLSQLIRDFSETH